MVRRLMRSPRLAPAGQRFPTYGHGRTAHMSPAEDDLTLALTLAQEADSLTMPRFGALDLRVETKPDLTPVTDADHDVEVALRQRLSYQRPNDSVFGEELGGRVEIKG